MSSRQDPLYKIFEQHLFNAMVEDETSDDFIGRVVDEYSKKLLASGLVPHHLQETLRSDLREEVLDMLRKKTYGHFSLTEFRKKKMAADAAIQKSLNQPTPREAARNAPSSRAASKISTHSTSALKPNATSDNTPSDLPRPKRFLTSTRTRRSS